MDNKEIVPSDREFLSFKKQRAQYENEEIAVDKIVKYIPEYLPIPLKSKPGNYISLSMVLLAFLRIDRHRCLFGGSRIEKKTTFNHRKQLYCFSKYFLLADPAMRYCGEILN